MEIIAGTVLRDCAGGSAAHERSYASHSAGLLLPGLPDRRLRRTGIFTLEKHNSMLCRYSAEFKRKVVDDYLSGGGSYQTIAIKYGILSEPTVMNWVRKYNSHEELTVSRPEGVYLVAKENKGRATTLEERIAIVEHCTANSYNYSLTAKEYNCSYSQVYSWVKKYQANGIV